MNPHQEAYVLDTDTDTDTDTDNDCAAFYAESGDSVAWAGPYGRVYVHQSAFDSCVDIGDNGPETRVVGMRLIDMQHSETHYVDLVDRDGTVGAPALVAGRRAVRQQQRRRRRVGRGLTDR